MTATIDDHDTETTTTATPTGGGSKPPSRITRNQERRRYVIIALIVFGVFLAGQFLRIHWNTLVRVDAPFTLRSDDRINITSPGSQDVIEDLPMTVTWELDDYELAEGEQFAVFVDTGFPSPRSDVRVRVCSVQAKLPPQPGELRAPCKDQRETVFFTTDTSMSFDCFEPRFSAGRARQHDHTVSVILVDADLLRVGETAASIEFRVDSDVADACRGF